MWEHIINTVSPLSIYKHAFSLPQRHAPLLFSSPLLLSFCLSTFTLTPRILWFPGVFLAFLLPYHCITFTLCTTWECTRWTLQHRALLALPDILEYDWKVCEKAAPTYDDPAQRHNCFPCWAGSCRSPIQCLSTYCLVPDISKKGVDTCSPNSQSHNIFVRTLGNQWLTHTAIWILWKI